MAQTVLNKNELFYAVNDKSIRTQRVTITGAADLVPGDILVPGASAGVYRAATDADKLDGANERPIGWRILLEAAAVSGGNVTANTGVTGGIDELDLVSTPAALTIDDEVLNTLRANGISVEQRTNSHRIAGEGV